MDFFGVQIAAETIQLIVFCSLALLFVLILYRLLRGNGGDKHPSAQEDAYLDLKQLNPSEEPFRAPIALTDYLQKWLRYKYRGVNLEIAVLIELDRAYRTELQRRKSIQHKTL